MKFNIHRVVASGFLMLATFASATSVALGDAGQRRTAGAQSYVSSSEAIASAVPPFGCGTAATIWTSDVPATPNAIPLGLAVADFTGDSNPDIATIELDRFDRSSAQYLVEIQLTEGGHQSLRLTAPPGGLFITPKDVTGDGTLDLVVRAVGFQLPVAVFINDGCGHFSAREPSRFANAIRDVPTKSDVTSILFFMGTPTVGQGSYTIACRDSSQRPLHLQRDSLFAGCDFALTRFDSSSGSNRAPPRSV